jgi:hypothetical protein
VPSLAMCFATVPMMSAADVMTQIQPFSVRIGVESGTLAHFV